MQDRAAQTLLYISKAKFNVNRHNLLENIVINADAFPPLNTLENVFEPCYNINIIVVSVTGGTVSFSDYTRYIRLTYAFSKKPTALPVTKALKVANSKRRR